MNTKIITLCTLTVH